MSTKLVKKKKKKKANLLKSVDVGSDFTLRVSTRQRRDRVFDDGSAGNARTEPGARLSRPRRADGPGAAQTARDYRP